MSTDTATSAHDAASPSPVTASAPAKRRPILVVDDEPEMLYSLRGLLRREFEVFTAASGAEGMAVLESREIHLVMTDQRMPQMTGVEFLSRIKSDHPGAMRLIFTGYADIRAVIDAINQGNVYRFVTKPWDPEELVKALREAGERYDQIIARNRLLGELRQYEAKCVELKDKLLSGQYGSLTAEGATEAERMVGAGRSLMARLDAALAVAMHEPMT